MAKSQSSGLGSRAAGVVFGTKVAPSVEANREENRIVVPR